MVDELRLKGQNRPEIDPTRRGFLKGGAALGSIAALERLLPESLHLIGVAAAEHLKSGIEPVEDGYARLFRDVRNAEAERGDLLIIGSKGAKNGWVPLDGKTSVEEKRATITITLEVFRTAIRGWMSENPGTTEAHVVFTHVHPSRAAVPIIARALQEHGKWPAGAPIPKSRAEIDAFLSVKKFSAPPSFLDTDHGQLARFNSFVSGSVGDNSAHAVPSATFSVLDESGAWFYRGTAEKNQGNPSGDPRASIQKLRGAWMLRVVSSPQDETWESLMRSKEFTELIEGYAALGVEMVFVPREKVAATDPRTLFRIKDKKSGEGK